VALLVALDGEVQAVQELLTKAQTEVAAALNLERMAEAVVVAHLLLAQLEQHRSVVMEVLELRPQLLVLVWLVQAVVAEDQIQASPLAQVDREVAVTEPQTMFSLALELLIRGVEEVRLGVYMNHLPLALVQAVQA